MRVSKSFCLANAVVALLLAAPVTRAAESALALPEKPAYVEMLRADHFRDTGDAAKAAATYESALIMFQKLRQEQPDYKPASIDFRVDYCRKQLGTLRAGGTPVAPRPAAPDAAAPAPVAAAPSAESILKARNEALEREIAALKTKLETPAVDPGLSKRLGDLEQSFVRLDEERRKTAEELKTMRDERDAALAKASAAEVGAKAFEARLQALMTENEQLRRTQADALQAAGRAAGVATDLEKAQERETALKKQIDDFQTALEAARTESRTWKEQAETASRGTEPLHRDLAALERDRTRLQAQVESLKAQIEAAAGQARAQTEASDAARKDLEGKLREASQANRSVEEWQKKVDQTTAERDAAVKDLETARAEATQAATQAGIVEKELKDQLVTTTRMLGEASKGEAPLRRQTDELQAKIVTLERDIENTRARAAANEAETGTMLKEAKDRASIAERDSRAAVKSEASLKKQNERLQTEIERLKASVESRAMAAPAEIDAQLKPLQDKITELVAEKDKLAGELSEARAAKPAADPDAARRIAQLEAECSDLRARVARAAAVAASIPPPAAPAPIPLVIAPAPEAPAPAPVVTPAPAAPDAPAPAIVAAPVAPPAVALPPAASPAAGGETMEHAIALTKDGDLAGAVRAYRTILDQDPVNALAMQNLAKLHLQQGESRSARRVAEQLARAYPETAAQQYAAGSILARAGDPKGAARLFETAATIEPGNVAYVRDLAVAQYQTGRYDEAAKNYRAVVEMKPDDGQAHFNLAALLLLQKEPARDDARQHYDKALALGEARDPAIEKKLNP